MDEQLRDLIAEIRRYEKSHPHRQKALNRLLSAIASLPGLYRSSHQDYPEAFNRTLEWASRNIEQFDPHASSSVQNSLVNWVNGYLKWRVRDLYLSEHQYKASRVSTSALPDGESINLIESLPSPRLSGLDAMIAQLQTAERQHQAQAIWQYIEQDPEQALCQCHPKKHAECNCQLLALRLLLQEPPQRIADIAREFNVNNQTLYSHWKQRCLPILREIGRRFRTQL